MVMEDGWIFRKGVCCHSIRVWLRNDGTNRETTGKKQLNNCRIEESG